MHSGRATRLLAAATYTIGLLSQVAAVAQTPDAAPSWAELEAAGARIGEVRVVVGEIFDTTDPKEDYLLFSWANALHIQTRPYVVANQLLFKTGDLVSVRVIEETERVLRGNRYLYDVQFRPIVKPGGVVDIEVLTRDSWSLDAGGSLGRAGGVNSSSVHLREYNLLGTGTIVSVGQSTDVDRTGTGLLIANERVLGSAVAASYNHATNSDGRHDIVSITRPFFALDERWAAGASVSNDDRIDSIYNAGVVQSQYRHRQDRRDAFGGWSAGLQHGWVRRYSVGLFSENDAYAPEPGLTPPAQMPSDEKLVGPYVRLEVVEDRFEKEQNRNLIGRPEFFALGLTSTVQLGKALPGMGSTRDAWVYSGRVSRGFEPIDTHRLMAAASIAGRYAQGQSENQHAGAQSQYYLPQTPHRLFYVSLAGDVLTRPDTGQTLELGGENGLRGYPLRYQSGTKRALLTIEQRFYTDLYVWQLFRIGGAAFFDTGRAWGGDNANLQNPGLLSDAGIGLRIVSARTALSNVLHIDLAYALNATPDIQKVQIIVKSKTSF
jgi:outer membrane protein assembly factor BamA